MWIGFREFYSLKKYLQNFSIRFLYMEIFWKSSIFVKIDLHKALPMVKTFSVVIMFPILKYNSHCNITHSCFMLQQLVPQNLFENVTIWMWTWACSYSSKGNLNKSGSYVLNSQPRWIFRKFLVSFSYNKNHLGTQSRLTKNNDPRCLIVFSPIHLTHGPPVY